MNIFAETLAIIRKKPYTLWGITLLRALVIALSILFFGLLPGIPVLIAILTEFSSRLICRKYLMGEEIRATDLFLFTRDKLTLKRASIGMCWTKLWIFIWSLIPVAGVYFGLKKTYESRIVPYILADEPEISATDALRISRERTRGRKKELFVIDLMWYGSITIVLLVLWLLSLIPAVGIVFTVLIYALLIMLMLFARTVKGILDGLMDREIAEKKLYCSRCGAIIGKDDEYCAKCGSKIGRGN